MGDLNTARPVPALATVRSFVRSMPVLARIGVVIVLIQVVVAVAAPMVAPYPPNTFVGANLQSPSMSHWFGTDNLGRDVLSRTLYGGRTAIEVAVPAAALGVLAAAVLGAVVALRRGFVDAFIGRVVDTFLAIPAIMTLLVIVAGFGSSTIALVLALAMIYGVPSLRVTRAAALQLANEDFIRAARTRGEGALSIACHELAPNLRDVVFVELAVRASAAVVLVASLSFLGLGVNPPTADWGRMIADNATYMSIAWWSTAAPLVALSSVVIALNLAADGIAKALGVDRSGGS